MAALLLGASVAAGGSGCRADAAGVDDGDEADAAGADFDAALDGALVSGSTRDAGATEPGATDDQTPPPEPPPEPPPPLSPDPPPGLRGAPADVGCADGTREGFADLATWPHIAGCSGGFRVPGLEGDAARQPQCDQQAGNTGANPAGVGCSVADLCATGWQVCEDAGDVERRSATGCVGAAPAGYAVLFLVRAGASDDGICIPGAGLANDLLGCGSFGDPAHPSCAPLDRRLDFAGCYATLGLWSCGNDQVHLQETAEVSKAGPGLGGVLCCKQD